MTLTTTGVAAPEGGLGRWLWVLALFVALQPFPLQLQGLSPYAFAPTGGRPFDFYLLIAVAVATVPTLVARIGKVSAILSGNLLLIAFVVFALLSAMWSRDPYLTLRSGVGLVGVVVIVVSAASACEPREFARRLLLALAAILILSVVFALVFPIYGIQRSDFESRAPRWRGVYALKNHLGMVSAFAFGLFLTIGPSILRRANWIVGMLLALVCVFMSRSGSGLVLTVVAGLFYLIVYRFSAWVRYVCVFLTALILPILITFGEDFLVYGTGLLGKDESFTGRTALWSAGLGLWREHPYAGQGLAAFSSNYVSDVFANAALAGGHVAVRDPHNAFLFLGIALGGFGLAILIGAILAAGGSALLRGSGLKEDPVRVLGLLPLMMWLVAGTVESAPFWPGTPEFMLGICGIVAASLHGRKLAEVVTPPSPVRAPAARFKRPAPRLRR